MLNTLNKVLYMHEATVALSILRRAIESAERHCGDSTANQLSESPPSLPEIARIVVRIGQFRNVDPESLEFAFNALRDEFAATRSSRLEISTVKASAICSLKGHKYDPHPDDCFACTICGGGIATLLCGEELDIVSIELQQQEEV